MFIFVTFENNSVSYLGCKTIHQHDNSDFAGKYKFYFYSFNSNTSAKQ